MSTVAEVERKVEQLKREARIARMFSRGHMTWAEGMDRLRRLGVCEERAKRILLGTA